MKKKFKLIFIIIALCIAFILIFVIVNKKNKKVKNDEVNQNENQIYSFNVEDMKSRIENEENIIQSIQELKMNDEMAISEYNEIENRINEIIESNPEIVKNRNKDEVKEELRQENIRKIIEENKEKREELIKEVQDKIKK